MTKRSVAVWIIATVIGLAVLFAMSFLNPGRTDFTRALEPPGAEFLLGSDHFGRSVAKAVGAAMGGSAMAAAVTAIATTTLGGIIGAARVFSRWMDRLGTAALIMTISMPSMLVTFIVAGILGGGRWTIAVVVMLTHWPIAAQLLGSRIRQVWEAGYTIYDRMLGASLKQLLVWHLVPRSAGRVVASMAIIFPSAVVHETTAAFLGIGVDPSAVALGPLIAWGRSDIAAGAWWTLVVPVLALTVLVLPAVVGASRIGGGK